MMSTSQGLVVDMIKSFVFGKWTSKPELGLANVEWVIVGDANVLFRAFF